MQKFPSLGFGLGLRTDHYETILEQWPSVDWFEIISENFMESEGRPQEVLEQIAARYPVVMHGVSLSIGSTDPLDQGYLTKLKALTEKVKPQWVSDHLCFTGVNQQNTHDLLPMPYTEDSLAHIVDRIKQVQDFLGRTILIENPSTYLEFKESTIPEWEFIARMAEQADCALLLDVNNVYVSSYNHRLDPYLYLDAMPMDRVVQIHLAGHENNGTHIVDTHDNHVIDEVWELYRHVIAKQGMINTMVEWDAHIPAFDVVWDEVKKAQKIVEDIEKGKAESGMRVTIAGDRDQADYGSAKMRGFSSLMSVLHEAILSGDNDNAQPDNWIPAKKDFSPRAQLDVYINGYRYRLFDTVSEDYPALRVYLGDELTSLLIRSYVEATPSVYFNVGHYIVGLPGFMEATTIVPEEKRDVALEIAHVEAAMSRLFDAENSTSLTQEDLQAIDPEMFLSLQLPLRKASALFYCRHDIDGYISEVSEAASAIAPNSVTSPLLVYRDDSTVWRLPLEDDEYKMLSLLNEGKAIGEVIELFHADSDISEDVLIGNLQQYFVRWLRHGVLGK